MLMRLFVRIYVGFGDPPSFRFSLLDSLFFDCRSAALWEFPSNMAFHFHFPSRFLLLLPPPCRRRA
jgi:hypothetical protein